MRKICLSMIIFGWGMKLTAASNAIADIPAADDCLDLSCQKIVYDQLSDRVSEELIGLNIQPKSKALSSYASKIKKSRYKCLNLSNNLLSDSGTIALAEMLKDHSGLEYLSIENNNVGGDALRKLLLTILPFEHLKLVNIRGNFAANPAFIKKLKAQMGEEHQNLVEKIIWQNTVKDTRTMPWEVDVK